MFPGSVSAEATTCVNKRRLLAAASHQKVSTTEVIFCGMAVISSKLSKGSATPNSKARSKATAVLHSNASAR